MAKTTGSELAAQSETNKPQIKKVARTAFAAVISAGLVGTFALPAYANLGAEEAPVVAANQAPQVLTTVEAEGLDVQVPAALAVVEDEELLERERLEAEREAERQAEEELRQRLAEEELTPQQEHLVRQFADIPSGAGGAGLLQAALAQLGVHQDCTAVLENGLRAIGYNPGDLGTGIWEYEGVYGTRVSLDSLAPGDILVYGNRGSGAHVAVYMGDGQAVHGGVYAYGGTAILPVHAAFEPLTAAVRPY